MLEVNRRAADYPLLLSNSTLQPCGGSGSHWQEVPGGSGGPTWAVQQELISTLESEVVQQGQSGGGPSCGQLAESWKNAGPEGSAMQPRCSRTVVMLVEDEVLIRVAADEMLTEAGNSHHRSARCS